MHQGLRGSLKSPGPDRATRRSQPIVNPKTKTLLFTLGKVAVAAVLLLIIYRNVDFRDTLVYPSPNEGEDAVRIHGTIVEERRDEVVFRVAESGRTRVVRPPAPGTSPSAERPAVRRGLVRIVRELDLRFALLGMGIYILALGSGMVRWYFLVRAPGIPATLLRVFQLSFVGYFFNSVVPGLVGGDLIKAIYVARGEEKKAAAVLSILVDRVIGLFVLLGIGAVAVSVQWRDYQDLFPFVTGFFAAIVLGGAVFYSHRLRRLFFLDRLMARFSEESLVRQAEQALFTYRYHRKVVVLSLGLSVIAHSVLILVHACIGWSIGIRVPLWSYFVTVPIMQTVSAIPLSPGGWGVGEATYIFVLATLGVPANEALSLSVLFRFANILWSLPGGLVWVAMGRGKKREADSQPQEVFP